MRYLIKYLIFLILQFFQKEIAAQLLSVGQEGQLTIIAGTDFTVDKLILTPSKSFTIRNNSLKESKEIKFNNTESIRKSYIFENDVISFSGKILIKYDEKDAVGLDENRLKIHVNNKTDSKLIESKPANIFSNTVESLPFIHNNIKGLTLGIEKSKEEFSILNNPVINSTLQVYANIPQYLTIYRSDGKMILRKFFYTGINYVDMSIQAHSTYIISSPNKSIKFIL